MRKIAVRIAGAPRVPPLPVMPWTPDSEAPRRLRNFVEEMLEDTPPARRTRNALGGPGIVVDGRLVSVDRATDSGLEMDAEGVDGKVRVKPNAAKAILREAAGVGVGLAADPGLEFDGNNGVRVKANADKAIVREAAGVGVKADAARRIRATSDGVGLADGTADKQMLAWDHDPGEWDLILPDGVNLDVNLTTGKLSHILGPHVFGVEPGGSLYSYHGFSLDANGHTRQMNQAGTWIGPAA